MVEGQADSCASAPCRPKVTEEELLGWKPQATERGVNLSEWCRETLLASVNGQER